VVEALACGKPVLISDQINIYSDIESDDAAVVENDSLEGTRQLLERWLRLQDNERQSMSTNAFACYQKRYLPSSAATKFIMAIKTDMK